MSTRVSPIERVRAEIDELFGSDRELGEVLEEVARLGVRLLMQTAIEAEITEFLGRERYGHGERARPGSRNGHCPTTIKTTTGPVRIDIYDILGRKVQTLVDEQKPAGYHQAIWDASRQTSGIYFYRVQTDEKTLTRKCILIK